MERKLIAVLAVVFGMSVAAGAQTGQTPSSSGSSPANQGGCYDTDASGKQVFVPNCGLPSVPERQTPAASAPTTPAQSADPAKAFPFPGETNTPVVQPDGSVTPPGSPLKDAGSSGDSSSGDSSSSSSSSSNNPLAGLPDDSNTRGPLADDDTVIKKPKKKLPPVAVQTPSQRADEDLSVYEFYMNDKNFRGAYARAQDAVTNASDDPNAHFALAEVARKLGMLDQSISEYKKTLELDPIPKQKKASEQAIKEMSGGA
jgi:predicted component of type VI protein secretion system